MEKVYEINKNELVDEHLKSIEDTIEELYDSNPMFAERADAYLEVLNKRWLLKNKDSKVNRNGMAIDIQYYLAAKKMMEINDLELDEDTYISISGALVKYYNDINEENVNELQNDIPIEIDGRNGKLNTMANLERYIVDLDPDYSEVIDDELTNLYDSFEQYYGISQSETTDEPQEIEEEEIDVEDEIEDEQEIDEEEVADRSVVEPEELKEMTLDELVVVLDNYSVVDNKLVKVR